MWKKSVHSTAVELWFVKIQRQYLALKVLVLFFWWNGSFFIVNWNIEAWWMLTSFDRGRKRINELGMTTVLMWWVYAFFWKLFYANYDPSTSARPWSCLSRQLKAPIRKCSRVWLLHPVLYYWGPLEVPLTIRGSKFYFVLIIENL